MSEHSDRHGVYVTAVQSVRGEGFAAVGVEVFVCPDLDPDEMVRLLIACVAAAQAELAEVREQIARQRAQMN